MVSKIQWEMEQNKPQSSEEIYLKLSFCPRLKVLKTFYRCPEPHLVNSLYMIRADSRFAPSQWKTPLQSNAVSHWRGTNQEYGVYENGGKRSRYLNRRPSLPNTDIIPSWRHRLIIKYIFIRIIHGLWRGYTVIINTTNTLLKIFKETGVFLHPTQDG